jgi:distribution and morphology protein 31
VNIDHLQSLTTLQGPISWITSGKVDVVLDIKFPTDPDSDVPLNVILGEIADAISAAAAASTSSSTASSSDRIPGQRELAKPPLTAPPSITSTLTTTTPTTPTDDDDNAEDKKKKEDDEPKVIIDIDLRFRDLKAAVPIFTNDLSYVNMALIRPIVYFMK